MDRSPTFSIGVQIGTPAPVYAPVVYVPVSRGPYYDSHCRQHYTNFELYYAHVNDRHAAAVHIRN